MPGLVETNEYFPNEEEGTDLDNFDCSTYTSPRTNASAISKSFLSKYRNIVNKETQDNIEIITCRYTQNSLPKRFLACVRRFYQQLIYARTILTQIHSYAESLTPMMKVGKNSNRQTDRKYLLAVQG